MAWMLPKPAPELKPRPVPSGSLHPAMHDRDLERQGYALGYAMGSLVVVGGGR